MKTKIAVITSIAVMMASLSFGAIADSQLAPVAPDMQPQSAQPQEAQQRHQEHFEKMKQKLTKHLQNKISRAQERLDCVQNAQDSKALRACLHGHKHNTPDHM
ncbi:MAG: hypothetical protein WCA63_06945 [Gallionella sp.]